MKKFILGLIVGILLGLPIGINMGKDVPLLSNPFADKPLSQRVKETTDAAKKKTDAMLDKTKKSIHEATK